jgi:hypothetical protein
MTRNRVNPAMPAGENARLAKFAACGKRVGGTLLDAVSRRQKQGEPRKSPADNRDCSLVPWQKTRVGTLLYFFTLRAGGNVCGFMDFMYGLPASSDMVVSLAES